MHIGFMSDLSVAALLLGSVSSSSFFFTGPGFFTVVRTGRRGVPKRLFQRGRLDAWFIELGGTRDKGRRSMFATKKIDT